MFKFIPFLGWCLYVCEVWESSGQAMGCANGDVATACYHREQICLCVYEWNECISKSKRWQIGITKGWMLTGISVIKSNKLYCWCVPLVFFSRAHRLLDICCFNFDAMLSHCCCGGILMCECSIFMLLYLIFDVLKQNFSARWFFALSLHRSAPYVFWSYLMLDTFTSFQMEYFLVKILARDYKMFNCRTKRMWRQ